MFAWDEAKAAANLRKHGVSFDEAALVFADPSALEGPDLVHSAEESRFVRLGHSLSGRLLMVAYNTERGGQ